MLTNSTAWPHGAGCGKPSSLQVAPILNADLRAKLQRHAPGLTPRQVLDHLAKIQMIDVRLPATDGRELLLRRRTEPNAEQQLLLTQLQLELPQQPPPKITGM